MDRSKYPTHLIRPGDPTPPDPVLNMTPEQRLAMMWPLTVEAWRFMGKPVDGERMRRDVVRVIRRGR
jgi:hypothetical protein